MTSSPKGNEVSGFGAETRSRRREGWLDRSDSCSTVSSPSKKRIWAGWCGSTAGADGIRSVSVATGMEGTSGHVHGVKMYLCGDFAFGEWKAGVDAVGCKRGSAGAKESAVCELGSPPVTGLSALSVGIFTSAVDEAAGVESGKGPRPLQRLSARSARPKASRMGFAIRDGEVMEEDCEKTCVTEVEA